MDTEYDQMIFDFNSKAKLAFFSIFEKFRNSTKGLDRRRDENVFQLQLSKYLFTFKEQLKMIVKELMYKNRLFKNTDRINRLLSDQINIYMNEFRQKARSF